MFVPTTPSEQILFTTVRIEAKTASGISRVGTGFFFDFTMQNSQGRLPLIITNNHIVENTVEGQFQFHEGDGTGEEQKPSGKFFSVALDDFGKRWVRHPNPNIDLCAMPYNPLLEEARSQEKTVFRKSLENKLVQTNSELEDLGAVEDILMVGYPIGLWDTANNLPIIRKGITASHPSVDYCGQSMGVVDVACFPGSSGSPIMIVNESSYKKSRTQQLWELECCF